MHFDEGFYNPVEPLLLTTQNPTDRNACDALIAQAVLELLSQDCHATSSLLVRAGSTARLHDLARIYESLGIPIKTLHSRMPDVEQRAVRRDLLSGEIRAVGVVGMLGEGFDLPALRIAAYHDKHKSLPATVQLIGRLARVHDDYPQESTLITVRDADVFPQLKGIVRQLYEEDTDWAVVLPGVIDDTIRQEQQDRSLAGGFSTATGEITPDRLLPLLRAVVYEIEDLQWRPAFAEHVQGELLNGAEFANERIVYSGVDPTGQLLVVGVQHSQQPRWTNDPGLAETTYQLHLVGFRPSPRLGQPSLIFLNCDNISARSALFRILDLDGVAQPASPERIGQYIDGLDRRSVSAVGMRSTSASNRGTTAYRNLMGSNVDRGSRALDMTRNALGHVNIQVFDESGSANAGAALEKAKVWVTRYLPLRAFDEWVERTATMMWFERTSASGLLLPGLGRGSRLTAWPHAPALAAELNPALIGRGFEIATVNRAIRFQDLEVLVTWKSDAVASTPHDRLRIRLVCPRLDLRGHDVVWRGEITLEGTFHGPTVTVRRGHSTWGDVTDLLEEHPPTIYFLDGSTSVGRIGYPPTRGAPELDPTRLVAHIWAGVDITAETAALAKERRMGEQSIHEATADWRSRQPLRGVKRWILLNDGSGEIVDFLVVEPLATGEIALSLWHAKASETRTQGLRVKDIQIVVAQALRCRKYFTSLELWNELALRLTQRKSPFAHPQTGSDDIEALQQFLGLADHPDPDFVPWTRRQPMIRGHVGIVQPGLSRHLALDEPTDGTESGIRQLLAVLSDNALADGCTLTVLCSG